ncbi:uncharacterized protein LOC119066273 [Bradysia coprophila]|uniref:uncharacterized protein LOC119066273 n=1 Tax=Bradysia coprophila TaxID=38358 RepID=UPI00187DBF45|nr:uncharacterized protein LOC119066273 [Bradysia coprophila]
MGISSKTVDFLDDINAKYATLECEIDQKLASISIDEKKFEKMFSSKRVTFEDRPNKACTNLESAKRRNAELIKELEISKARLRSRATYSPLEQVLNKAIENYVTNSELPQSTIRKRYGPTYV